MAFSRTGWQTAGGNAKRGVAPQIHTYITTDPAATVDTAGYFNANTAYGGVYNDLVIGDLIWRVTLSGSALSTCGFHVVKDLASGTVDVTNAEAVTVGDSD
jgi:hypothetical protein